MKIPVSLAVLLTASAILAAPATGPLRPSRENPRYFADPSGKIVYVTGLHTWANFQDQGEKEPLAKFDYNGYLDRLEKLNHNFIRLWSWEEARWAPWSDGKGKNPSDWYISPNPYSRPGPGMALDGKPKFDLEKFDDGYFARLRERVQKAGARGIYVSIMLFQGWSSSKAWLGGKPWEGHPYNRANNIQKFDGNPSGTSGPRLDMTTVRERQAAYIRKVVDTVNDLDNVLYEVTNEGGDKDWDWWVVNTVHEYERRKSKQHPIGLTGHGSETNDEMLASPADWFSPGSNNWPDLKTDPREYDGKKPSLVDTDHVWGVGGSPQWVWKVFMRGHNLLFMDPYDDAEWARILERENLSVTNIEGTRKAMGYTRQWSSRVNLANMQPTGDLSSTRFCLANPGNEYMVYQADSKDPFTVKLPTGDYRFEWFEANKGASAQAGEIKTAGAQTTFTAPFDGDAVLYLKRK